MQRTTVECDQCGAGLTGGGQRPDFRLVLSCEQLPTGDASFLVHVEPPLGWTHHFCGLDCLKDWLRATLVGREASGR